MIVDRHHKVLRAWANYRRTLSAPPRLLTLDHHTDTSEPFRNRIDQILEKNDPAREHLKSQWIAAIDYNYEASVDEAIEKLNNDEHILTALRAGIISSALVIAHNAMDTDMSIYQKHKIICRSVSRDPKSKKVSRAESDQVLESSFLTPLLESFDELLLEAGEEPLESKPFILDIDLDYLNTFASVCPKDPSTMKRLAQRAGLITIATEPDYVKHCALDSDLTSHELLFSLKSWLNLLPTTVF